MRILFFVSFLIMISVNVFSFDFDYYPSGESGGLPLEYISVFTSDAHAGGLGNAFTAGKGSCSSVYWNPAGLSEIYFSELGITSIFLFAGTQYTSCSFAYPFNEKNKIGLSIFRLSSGFAEKTDSLGDTLGYNFNETLTTFYLTGCSKILKELSCGLNFKIVYQSIDDYSAQGYGLDAGIIYDYTDQTTYGVNIQNLFPVQLGTDNSGTNLKLGLIHRFIQEKLLSSIDFTFQDIFREGYFKWAFGVEYKIIYDLWLRVGANTRELTFGFGFNTKKFDLNYAVGVHPVDFIHKISVNVRYGFLPTEEEKRIEIEREKLAFEKKRIQETIKIEKEKLKDEKKKLELENWINTKLSIAQKYFSENRYKDAEAILNKILEKDPSNIPAKDLKSEINQRMRKEYISAKYLEALNFYKKQDYVNVIQNTETILKLDPEFKKALILEYLAHAQIFIQDKKFKEAKGELIEVIKLDPTNEEATILLKRIQTILDIFEERGLPKQ